MTDGFQDPGDVSILEEREGDDRSRGGGGEERDSLDMREKIKSNKGKEGNPGVNH